MAYEYNSQDQRFEFPNPYKIENIFKVAGATVFICAGLWLLYSAKQAFGVHLLVAVLPLMVGILMLVYGGHLLTKGLSNLKFYFGRNQPIGLAQELSAQSNATTHAAQDIKDILRQSALSYHEPRGSMNGILYSLFPNLIFSPIFIRQAAEVQFQNAIIFIITLASALIATLGASQQSAAWLGIFYNILTLVVLLRPMVNPSSNVKTLGISHVVALVVIAIIGPVIVPFVTHNTIAPEWLPSMGKAIFTLVAASIAIGLFFLAVLAQMVKVPPQASAGMVQDSLSMNAQPMQLFDELERHLQEQWVSAIPNRIYSRILPQLELNKECGIFEGEILEETQPVPTNTLKDMTLLSCFKEQHYRWLGILNSFGLLCFFVAVVLLCIFANGIYNGTYLDLSYVSYGFFGFSMWILGKFCFDHGNYLWSRFDFISNLIWVEAKGSYQLSRMNFGRYLEDSIKTQKDVVNIETMTLRVWYAEISTTTFGKDQKRSILSMVARKDQAEILKDHLNNFAQNQSMIVAPTASSDLSRISAINQLNQTVNATTNKTSNMDGLANPNDTLIATTLENSTEQNTTTQRQLFCTACGTQINVQMRFCPQCGTQRAE